MAISEHVRQKLYLHLVDYLGHEDTEEVMAQLPPVGWAEVATKSHLDEQTALLRSELDARTALLRSELEAQTALLRSELEAQTALLRRDVEARIGGLRSELEAQTGSLRSELEARTELLRMEVRAMEHAITAAFRGELNTAITAQTRTMLWSMLGTVLTTGSLLLAAVGLA